MVYQLWSLALAGSEPFASVIATYIFLFNTDKNLILNMSYMRCFAVLSRILIKIFAKVTCFATLGRVLCLEV